MKIKILGLALVLCLLLVVTTFAQAIFKPVAKVRQIVVKIADFVAPPSVDFDFTANYLLPKLTTLTWPAVKDYLQTHQPVSYEIQFDQLIYQSTQNSIALDLSLMAEGQHELRIRACDSLKNCSKWSRTRLVTIDGAEPVVKLLNKGFVMREAIGDNWLLVGEGDFSNEGWAIGSNEEMTEVSQNYLQFELQNEPPLSYFAFDFLWETEEDLSEFDQPGLAVLVNEKIIFVAERQESLKWQRAVVDLSRFTNTKLTVKIMMDNDVDNFPTRLKIKNVTTNLATIRNQGDLLLQVSDELDSSPSGQLLWTENQVSYFATDSAGNQTDLISAPLFYDLQPPSVKILDKKIFSDQSRSSYLKLSIDDDFGLSGWEIPTVTPSGTLSISAVGHSYLEGVIFADTPFWIKVPFESTAGFEVTAIDLAGNQIKEYLTW